MSGSGEHPDRRSEPYWDDEVSAVSEQRQRLAPYWDDEVSAVHRRMRLTFQRRGRPHAHLLIFPSTTGEGAVRDAAYWITETILLVFGLAWFPQLDLEIEILDACLLIVQRVFLSPLWG